MRIRWRRRNRSRTASDILNGEDSSAPWIFIEGSISVSASIAMSDAIARCDRCGGWPIIQYFKRLTEQEDGVIIAGMALLFPTALTIYLGVQMIFSAYRDYKRWREAWIAQARQEGREDERARQKRALEERGLSLDPETEKILFGESDGRS